MSACDCNNRYTDYGGGGMGRSYEEFSQDLQQSWTPKARRDADTMAAGARALYEDDLRQQTGRTLKRLRTEQGLRQADVAARAGVRQTDVSAIERGLGNPTTHTFFAITTALQARVQVIEADSADNDARQTTESHGSQLPHPRKPTPTSRPRTRI